MDTKRRRSVNAATAPETRRFNAHLRDESLRRLMVHAVMTRRPPGDLLSELIDLHLRQFSMPSNLSDRATKRHSHDSATVSVEGEINEPIAA
jgi:hypothetical protein